MRTYLRFWDARQPTPMTVIDLPERVYCADVTYPVAVVGIAGRQICLFDLNKGPKMLPPVESPLMFQVLLTCCPIVIYIDDSFVRNFLFTNFVPSIPFLFDAVSEFDCHSIRSFVSNSVFKICMFLIAIVHSAVMIDRSA